MGNERTTMKIWIVVSHSGHIHAAFSHPDLASLWTGLRNDGPFAIHERTIDDYVDLLRKALESRVDEWSEKLATFDAALGQTVERADAADDEPLIVPGTVSVWIDGKKIADGVRVRLTATGRMENVTVGPMIPTEEG